MKVLVVDDDGALLDLLVYTLRRARHRVVPAVDGHQALERWRAERPDLVVLDVNLSGINGFEVGRRIRQAAPTTPIILLAGRRDEEDVLQGFQLGADDYMTKPFSPRELLARIETVYRRYAEAARAYGSAGGLRVGDLALDPLAHTVIRAGEPVHLTQLEFGLLAMLMQNAGRVVPYGSLISAVWDDANGSAAGSGDSLLLKSHIHHIRKKLRLPRTGPGSLSAAPGLGYRLSSV